MKKKIFKIIAVIITISIVITIGVFLNEIFGNPISKKLTEKAAIEHLAKYYSDTDFVIEKVGYDFKNMHYYAKIISSSDPNKFFYITTDYKGNHLEDNYDWYFGEHGIFNDNQKTTD